MELREPKRKCRVRVSLQQPFPVSTDKALWQVYTGMYSGDFVMVDAPDEMIALHNMGFFGKGSLSRGNPEFGKARQQSPAFVRHWQWERRCKWAKQMEAIMNGIETKQEAVMKFTCEEECNKEVQVRSEITVTTGNQASLEPRGSIIPDDRIQERNSEMCGINSTVQKYGPIKTKTVENSNSSGGNNVKSTFCVVNTDKELITEDCADTNEQNRNRVVECHSSEGSGTIVMSDNCSTEEGGTEEYKKSLADKSKRRMLLVLPDSDSDYEGYLNNVCPRLEEEQFPVHETLHLTLEEAFFLSFGLGCLQVIDLFGNCLSLAGMWQLFCKAQKDFVQKYVTYHYFRSKGWVVKPGVKFGGDFLLYKQGPPFYHASYIVLVEVIDKSTLRRIPGLQRSLSWTRLMGLNRVGESAGKEILVCQVIWPSDASPESIQFPSILSKFQVHEVLIRRWVSSQEREESDVS